MNRSRITLPVFVALTVLAVPSSLLLGGPPAAASAAARADLRSVEQSRESVLVTGTGEVSGKPDVLAANFAVETGASTVGEALNQATAAATRMRDALVRAGVASSDLQTSELGINSRRDDDQKITGYTVSQGLSAKIRKLPQAGAVISAAVAAGGDAARLNGVSFAIEDDAALRAEARRKAFADARGKAELYAREAGRPLGRVVRISEETPGYGGPGLRGGMGAADSAAAIEPGRQQVTATVTVEWALGPLPVS